MAGPLPSHSSHIQPYHTGFASQNTAPGPFSNYNYSSPSRGQPYQTAASNPAQLFNASDPGIPAGRPYGQGLQGGFPGSGDQSSQRWGQGMGSDANLSDGGAATAHAGGPQFVSHQSDTLQPWAQHLPLRTSAGSP